MHPLEMTKAKQHKKKKLLTFLCHHCIYWK